VIEIGRTAPQTVLDWFGLQIVAQLSIWTALTAAETSDDIFHQKWLEIVHISRYFIWRCSIEIFQFPSVNPFLFVFSELINWKKLFRNFEIFNPSHHDHWNYYIFDFRLAQNCYELKKTLIFTNIVVWVSHNRHSNELSSVATDFLTTNSKILILRSSITLERYQIYFTDI